MRVPMSKTVFQQFVYIYKSWQPTSNLQTVGMTKLLGGIRFYWYNSKEHVKLPGTLNDKNQHSLVQVCDEFRLCCV